MENSTNSTRDDLSPGTRRALEIVMFIIYDVFPYPYFVLGILGHARSFYTCYQQSKTESGYLIQMLFSGVRIMEIIGFMLLIFAFNKWARVETGIGASWFRSNYALMWFTAHLIIPLANAFITASMFMQIFISLDRVMAIGRPVSYRVKWHKKRYRVGALLASLLIGFTLVSYDVGRLTVKRASDGLYMMYHYYEVRTSVVAFAFNAAKNCANFGGLLALIVCNGAVVRLYRSRVVNSGLNRMTRQSEGRTNADLRREVEQQRTQRTLFVLSVCQNVIATISVGFMVSMYLADYFATKTYYQVEQSAPQRSGAIELGWPLCDGVLMLAALLDFYVPVMVSKSLRRIMFPWCVKKIEVMPIDIDKQQEQGAPDEPIPNP